MHRFGDPCFAVFASLEQDVIELMREDAGHGAAQAARFVRLRRFVRFEEITKLVAVDPGVRLDDAFFHRRICEGEFFHRHRRFASIGGAVSVEAERHRTPCARRRFLLRFKPVEPQFGRLQDYGEFLLHRTKKH